VEHPRGVLGSSFHVKHSRRVMVGVGVVETLGRTSYGCSGR
jgi:hypothetical protein